MYFATRARLDRLAVNLGADPLASGTGFYFIWPSDRLDIVAAVAVVGADLSAAERQATIVHQLTHALGLRGDSAVFPESALFTEGDRVRRQPPYRRSTANCSGCSTRTSAPPTRGPN